MPLTSLFIFGVFATLFLGALWNPILGVSGYLAVYILYNPDIWWGASVSHYLPRPSLIASIFLITGSFLHMNKLDWTISRREIEFYLFLGVAWLSTLVFGQGVEEINWRYLEKLTKLFLFVLFFLRVVHSIDPYKLVNWTLMLGGVFLAYQAHIVSSALFYEGRLNALGGIDFREANQFASFLVMTIILSGFQMLRAAWLMKIAFVVGIAAMLNAVIMTQSRAVFLGVILASPFILFRVPAQFRKQIYVTAGLGIVLFLVLADVKFLDRMSTISDTMKDMSLKVELAQDENLTRLDFWRASLLIFADHPLGIGVKNFQKLVPYYDPRNYGLDAHSTYILCYTELGILGIVIFIVVIAETLFQLRRIRRMVISTPFQTEISLHAAALETVLVIYLLGIMPTHSILYSEILWIILALPICLENATKKLLQDEHKVVN